MKRITPSHISELNESEIFVFGSNLSGTHGSGAARLAYEKFGAEFGNGEGFQGRSYAIPTISKELKRSLTIEEIEEYVNEFIEFAEFNHQLTFLVTEIGCGIAGHKVKDIAPLFWDAITLENVFLPESFWIQLNVE